MSAAAAEVTKRLLRQTHLGDALLNVPLAAVVIDPGTRTYLAVNDFMCRFSGYAEDELVGMHVGELNADALDELRWQRLLNVGIAQGASELVRRDGVVVEVDFLAAVTKVGGLDFVLSFFWAAGSAPPASAL